MSRKRACDVCYRRKIQCFIPNPEEPCDWCNDHALSCTFTRQVQKKKRNRLRLSDVEGLFSRVERLESVLAQNEANYRPGQSQATRLTSSTSDNEDDLLQSDSSSSPDVQPNPSGSIQIPVSLQIDTQLTGLSLEEETSSAVPLAQYWYCRGIPLLSKRGQRWIFSKTDEDIASERSQLLSRRPNPLPPARPPLSSIQGLWELPLKETVQKLVTIFFKSSFQLTFPVLDKMLFDATIEKAYECIDGMPSRQQALSKACVLAALSIMCRLEGSNTVLPGADGVTYAAKAQGLLGHVSGEASLVGLQTVLLLQRHQMSTGQNQNVTLLHAVACRMVCALGGHTYQPLELYEYEMSWAERQRHHLRMLFWLCYSSDKDISLRSGQPPLLTEQYCDLTVPESCTSYCAHLLELDEAITCDKYHSHIPGDPSLCCLKEKIYRLLFSAQAFKISDGDLVLRIRQLDEDLESWRLSIATEFRPKLSISPSQPELTTEAHILRDIRGAHLQLEYHHLVTAIHTTVRRCGADSPESHDLPDDLHSVIHSSCDLSLEASRSMLTFLKKSTLVLAEMESSYINFYPTLAAVSLFIDILAHPRGAQSHIAIRDLLSAIDIIRSLSGPSSTRGELQQMQEITGFITELTRLGKCAISKAEQG